MDQQVTLWIIGLIITLATLVIGYLVNEIRDLKKRFHIRNNEFSLQLTKLAIEAKGVSKMAEANEKSQSELKITIDELRTTLIRLSNELSRLSGFLDKGK